MREPDFVVLRHGPDVPVEYQAEQLEGLWLDRVSVPPGFSPGGLAVAEPVGTFEQRDDGAVAEVWEIRLRTPREMQGD